MRSGRPRFSLLGKVILFLAAVLVPLAAVTWFVSVQTLGHRMTEEFTAKGTAIASSLASSGVDLVLTRDPSTVQAVTIRAEEHLEEIAGMSTSSAQLAQGISRTSAQQADGVEGVPGPCRPSPTSPSTPSKPFCRRAGPSRTS